MAHAIPGSDPILKHVAKLVLSIYTYSVIFITYRSRTQTQNEICQKIHPKYFHAHIACLKHHGPKIVSRKAGCFSCYASTNPMQQHHHETLHQISSQKPSKTDAFLDMTNTFAAILRLQRSPGLGPRSLESFIEI